MAELLGASSILSEATKATRSHDVVRAQCLTELFSLAVQTARHFSKHGSPKWSRDTTFAIHGSLDRDHPRLKASP